MALPDKFRETMVDFVRDLTTTFPEFADKWSQWLEPDVDMAPLLQHCLAVYPAHFFDILNENADLFRGSEVVSLLPHTDFCALFACEGITEKTRQSIWKYLQVILFMVVGAVQDKADFGPSMNLFEGMAEDELQDKLKGVMGGLGDFFGKMEQASETAAAAGPEDESSEDEDDPFKSKASSAMPSIPKPEDIHKHLMELFNGKIGKLAKELAEDLGEDFAATLGEDMKDAKSTQEILTKLMKDPQKVSGLVKTVGDKLNAKMAAGDISREDIMKEASDMMKKMKEMGGGQDFTKMFKSMAKGMGVNIPKGAKIDQNAMKQFEKKMSMREKMVAKAQQRQEKKLVEKAAELAKREEQLEKHRQLLAARQQAASAGSQLSVDDLMATLGLTDDVNKGKKNGGGLQNKKK
jgi:hypothetical protein